ncbi:uncharacterized protein I206_102232 [Kwoniella pini CBS 10737]|uniref:Uncharacterized protein n=1 Tax=Kwoniella pini CBS 10737 TaxID=1296096 RepID=A0A1B9HSW9_9TREE|nr:uncharacterized protein I206_07600 [Kwoniella pini CBS 10737]OCF46367.1 hypothetical protein I206_07600 [Kwoniella pini CBS 10737]
MDESLKQAILQRMLSQQSSIPTTFSNNINSVDEASRSSILGQLYQQGSINGSNGTKRHTYWKNGNEISLIESNPSIASSPWFNQNPINLFNFGNFPTISNNNSLNSSPFSFAPSSPLFGTNYQSNPTNFQNNYQFSNPLSSPSSPFGSNVQSQTYTDSIYWSSPINDNLRTSQVAPETRQKAFKQYLISIKNDIERSYKTSINKTSTISNLRPEELLYELEFRQKAQNIKNQVETLCIKHENGEISSYQAKSIYSNLGGILINNHGVIKRSTWDNCMTFEIGRETELNIWRQYELNNENSPPPSPPMNQFNNNHQFNTYTNPLSGLFSGSGNSSNIFENGNPSPAFGQPSYGGNSFTNSVNGLYNNSNTGFTFSNLF